MAKICAASLLSLLAVLATGPTASRCAQGFVAGWQQRQPSSLAPTTGTPASPVPLPPAFVSCRGGAATVASPASSSSALAAEAAVSSDAAATEAVPSWESLEAELEKLRSSSGDGQEKKPVLTLYRDTNGWCPFCERVWVAVRAKGLPYQETLVPLQGKPEWYKQMVPTGLVPAVLFHGDEDGGGGSDTGTSRELVWESDAILEALDAKFPETPRLMRKGEQDFDDALDLQNRLQAAGFAFAYGNRNGTLTDAELQQNRDGFDAVLDELDAALAEQAAALGTDTCFRLGAEFSGLDAIMVPTLERWRYQLPITNDVDILARRSHLKNWFDTMDAYEAYGGRVAGDEYSWTATASMFFRYFGGGEDQPKVAAGIARADAAAEKFASAFASSSTEGAHPQEAALEAAAKLLSNHAAVVADCLREEPLSQQHIPRASGTDTADVLLRHVVSVLLETAAPSPSASAAAATDLLVGCDADATAQGALALRTVSKRLCVPRDMGAPSAALLRKILCSVADDLLVDSEEEEGANTAGTREAVVA